MKPVPLQPNLPTPTTAFGNPAPIAQYYICPHCNKQSPLAREWVGLTDEEIHRTTVAMGFNPEWTTEIGVAHAIVRNLEVKLKERNT